MHGVIVGAILGVAAVACMGAYRSYRNWQGSRKRPPGWVLALQIGLQIALAATAVIFAFWIMLVGE